MLILLVWDSPFCVLKDYKSKFLNYDVFMSLKIVYISANSADSDISSVSSTFAKVPVPKYQFTSIQNEKD